jgi:hypothetical protein
MTRPRHALLLLLLVGLAVQTTTCKLQPGFPTPLLELECQEAYSTGSVAAIRFRFVAEEDTHPCRFVFSKIDSDPVELQAGSLADVPSGVWNEYRLDLSGYDQGKYSFRLVVQADHNGELADLSFLDRAVVFYMDWTPPASPDYSKTDIRLDGFHVYVNQAEWITPGGSPVSVRYEVGGQDGQDPGTRSPLYNMSTGIVVPLSEYDETVRARAFDLAGNASATFVHEPVFVDDSPPAEPTFAPVGGLYVGDQHVTLGHSEWTAPVGSPVDVYYTLDGVDPTATSYRYSGVPVIVSSSATPVTLKARGIDMAGNLGPVASSSYSFMAITSVENLLAPPDALNSGRLGTLAGIEIHGYGFNESAIPHTFLRDADGTTAVIQSGPTFRSSTWISMAVYLTEGSGTGGSDPGMDVGMGRVEVCLESPPTAVASFPFEILPH